MNIANWVETILKKVVIRRIAIVIKVDLSARLDSFICSDNNLLLMNIDEMSSLRRAVNIVKWLDVIIEKKIVKVLFKLDGVLTLSVEMKFRKSINGMIKFLFVTVRVVAVK